MCHPRCRNARQVRIVRSKDALREDVLADLTEAAACTDTQMQRKRRVDLIRIVGHLIGERLFAEVEYRGQAESSAARQSVEPLVVIAARHRGSQDSAGVPEAVQFVAVPDSVHRHPEAFVFVRCQSARVRPGWPAERPRKALRHR